jgi:hypothetical protein
VNQADPIEVEYSVRNMDNVYHGAEDVLIWLGPGNAESDMAMFGIGRMLDAMRALQSVPHWLEYEEHGLPAVTDDFWEALQKLFERPWFQRTWTFQEIVLAKRATVHCGTAAVSWEKFSLFIFLMVRNTVWPGFGVGSISRTSCSVAAHIHKLQLSHRGPDKIVLDVHDLLQVPRGRLCGKLHDHVYGILNLCEHDFRQAITVDYAMPIRNLFMEVAVACLQRKTKGATPYLQYLSGQQLRRDWPSWCIDLSSTHGLGTFAMKGFRAGCRRSEESQGYFALKAEDVHHETGVVVLRGFRVDTVSERLLSNFLPAGKEHTSSDVLAKERVCRELTERTMGTMGEGAPTPAYLSTLTCTPVQFGHPNWLIYKAAYSDMLNSLHHVNRAKGWQPPTIKRQVACDSSYKPFSNITMNPCRAFLSTFEGRVGNGPYTVERGDHIVVIYGIGVVLFLRTSDTRPGHMRFVGTGYVHGLMDLDMLPWEAIGEWEKFLVH